MSEVPLYLGTLGWSWLGGGGALKFEVSLEGFFLMEAPNILGTRLSLSLYIYVYTYEF